MTTHLPLVRLGSNHGCTVPCGLGPGLPAERGWRPQHQAARHTKPVSPPQVIAPAPPPRWIFMGYLGARARVPHHPIGRRPWRALERAPCPTAHLPPHHHGSTGNNRATHFWEDARLDDAPLSQAFLALHSHATNANITVHDAVVRRIQHYQVSRLTVTAEQELQVLEELMAEVTLNDLPDSRSSPLEGANHSLKASLIYKLATTQSSPCDFFDFVWRNRAPPRVQFFAWLLV